MCVKELTVRARELFVKDRLAIAITSMERVGERIYLGLTGGANILAWYDVAADRIELGPELFPWIKGRGYCAKIHNALGALSDGSLLMGEANHFTWDGIPVTLNYLGKELPESMLFRKRAQGYPDVKYGEFCLPHLEGWNRATDAAGGKIVRYWPDSGRAEDLGMLPGMLYVQSMIVDTARDRAFGHTLPDNHFFYVDVRKGAIKDFGHISDFAHHNMVVTPRGVCYGGWIDKAENSLKLLRFDPEEERLNYLNKVILKDVGAKVAGNQGIDEWIVTSRGEIYMGVVANSLFFRFHEEEEEFELIGQVAKGGRVTSIDEDEHGMIWIGADYPHMRLVRFDPRRTDRGKFTDFGRVNDSYPRCYFHASCCYKGKLYLGETDGFVPSLHIVDLGELG